VSIRSLHEGQELVTRILDAVPGGVVHVGKDGEIVHANPDALRILGYRFDEVTKRFIADWDPVTINEDGSSCPVQDYPVAKVLTTGQPNGPQTIGIRRPDGELVWAVFRAVPVRDPDGQLDGAVVTFIDITERKAAEERWRLLAENLPDFVVVTDAKTRIVSINRTLPDIDLANVIGTSSLEWLDQREHAEWMRHFEQVLETGRSTRIETRGRGPDGTIVWYDTIMAPIPGPEGGRVIVVARDVTERRAMLAQLAEKERLASVGMVAASVAHEIMNPLTYVLANLDFALGENGRKDEQRLVKALSEAREGAKRMQQIVWDLRSLGRTGGEELFYVDARSVLETALRLSGHEVGRAARIVLDLQEVPGVLASESRLCQVFINLLVNAAQSMDHRPLREREITVRTRHDDSAGLVGIDVSDRGTGIGSESLDRIFEPFYTTKRAGTGLGLSISRDIVQKMGGKIAVESTVGQGTTFTVWLSTTRSVP
jgi:PAS domain S-box-containing protein